MLEITNGNRKVGSYLNFRDKKMKKIIAISLLSIILMAPLAVFGQDYIDTPPAQVITDIEEVFDWLREIVNWVFVAIMILVVLMILWAAFDFITAGGSEDKTNSAKKKLTYAIIGIVVALLAWTIPYVVQSFITP